jgi:uncharacterized protein YfiM (DUF2279 family)
MIGIITMLVANWKLVAGVAGTAAVFALLAAGAAYEHHQGYSDGYSVAHQQCEDEKAKMETANQNAINKAAKSLASAEAQIQVKEGQIDDYVKELDAAADAAPNANSCGLDADATKRLDAIR